MPYFYPVVQIKGKMITKPFPQQMKQRRQKHYLCGHPSCVLFGRNGNVFFNIASFLLLFFVVFYPVLAILKSFHKWQQHCFSLVSPSASQRVAMATGVVAGGQLPGVWPVVPRSGGTLSPLPKHRAFHLSHARSRMENSVGYFEMRDVWAD